MIKVREEPLTITHFIGAFVLLAGVGIPLGLFYQEDSRSAYDFGYAFDKAGMGGSFLAWGIVMLCGPVYAFGGLFIFFGTLLKIFQIRWLLAVILVPVITGLVVSFVASSVNRPTFRDGMSDRVCRDLSEDHLLDFAEAARKLRPSPPSDNDRLEDDELADLLKRYPAIAALHASPARAWIRPGYVEIYWGGHIGGICGLRIVDAPEIQEPIMESEKNGACALQNVYPRTWVYVQTF